MKIGIIGSGNVGITTAFALAERGTGDVMLYDVVEGRAKGKALDLIEAAPLRRYDRRIIGVERFADLLDADVFVIAAGKPRRASMKRTDLLDDNLPVVTDIARRLKAEYKKPEPPIVVVLTEPVDLMTLAVTKSTGWPREKVIGVGAMLSAARLRHFIARELNLDPIDIDAMVVGTHAEGQMVFLERYCRVSGLPLSQFLKEQQISELLQKTEAAGSLIVDLAKTGSSFYTPGAAVGAVIDSIAKDANRIMPVSIQLRGEFGAEGLCASVPAKLGKGGVKQIYKLQLTAEEKTAFKRSVEFQKPFAAKIG
ncbi:MAG: malate dehydrogenase [Myxococcales bacterium]|nr:MAG: malate dehydrogenase [Myxococcales bacterium]